MTSSKPTDDTDIRAVLAAIILPDGRSLGQSGLISGVSLSGGRVSVALEGGQGSEDALAPLRERIEHRLKALPGISSVFVVLTSERPVPPKLTPDAPKTSDPLAGIGHVIAVASGKGGVGKSTTSVNLALGLRMLGLKVGILDADIYGPSLPTLLGLHGKPTATAGRKLLPVKAFGLKAMSMGLLVDADTAMVWRGPMVMSAITQMMADVDWGALDVLIVDMPPGTGDAQLALAQGTRLAGAVIVSTPQDLSLIDARRGIAMFRKVNVPILGIVENMSHFTCSECGTRHAIFGAGGAQLEAARLGVPFLGGVPLTMELRAASDAGQPIMARDPDGPLGRIYTEIARLIMDGLNAETPDLRPAKA